jgi:hypothetical protein
MEINRSTFLLLAAVMVCSSGELLGQSVWTKDTRNPIFLGGGAGSWDHHVFMTNVLFNEDSSRYEMWYAGSYGPPWRPYRIGFAWSRDGISWTKYAGNPVLTPDPGTWDEGSVEAGRVMRENGQYKMWYAGVQNSNSQIGYATSPDGMHWTKYAGNPVIKPAAIGWEAGSVYTGAVMWSPSGYTMFYEGAFKVGRATSVDGVNWQKDTLHSPVLDVGVSGQWDDVAVISTCVFSTRDTLTMLYIGSRSALVLRQGGIATSSNWGITWTKNPANPVLKLGSAGRWDASHVEPGTVLRQGNLFEMWYDGTNEPSDVNLWKIGHATSSPASIRPVPSQYSTIQAAIDAALHGDTVLVDEGTYYENIRYNGKHIVLGSRYVLDSDTSHISRTIINGSTSANADSGSVVSFLGGEDTTSVLCGFTITGGTGTTYSPGFYTPFDKGGGGVYVKAGARISHNHITLNTISPSGTSSLYGAGIGTFRDSAKLIVIEHNDIDHNSISANTRQVGGAGITLSGMVRIVHNSISDNTLFNPSSQGNANGGGMAFAIANIFASDNLIARNIAAAPNSLVHASFGGGIHTFGTNMHFANNRVIDNLVQGASNYNVYGGGLSVFVNNDVPGWPQGDIVIESNLFRGNRAVASDWCAGGGISVWNEKPLIQNNVIVGNLAFIGGGVGMIRDLYTTAPTLINNTISNNRATSNVGGGIASRGVWTPRLINSIAWGDTGSQEIALLDGSAINVQYSNIQGPTVYPGQGNINANPLFLDATYRLSDYSTCIGAGADSILMGGTLYRAPPTDIYGLARPTPFGSQPDIGACENPNPIVGVVEGGLGMPPAFALSQNYPNPFNPSTTIPFALPHKSHVTLTFYNTLGQLVATMVNGELEAGYHKVTFDGSDLASGVYFYRLRAGEFVQSMKLVILR